MVGSTVPLHVSRNRPSAVVLVLSHRSTGPAVNVNVDGVLLRMLLCGWVRVTRMALLDWAVPVGPSPLGEDLSEVHCSTLGLFGLDLSGLWSAFLLRMRGPVAFSSQAFAWSCSQNSSFLISIVPSSVVPIAVSPGLVFGEPVAPLGRS